ncbi:hypothetical protein OSTOST_16602 [Ostertagia ostertagi]
MAYVPGVLYFISGTMEDIAVTKFREYLRVNTEQPNPDYAACQNFLFNLADELGIQRRAVEASDFDDSFSDSKKRKNVKLPKEKGEAIEITRGQLLRRSSYKSQESSATHSCELVGGSANLVRGCRSAVNTPVIG